MSTRILTFFLLITFSLCHTRAADQPALYQKVSAAAIEVYIDGRLMGSGWFTDQAGWAMTALHVVGNHGKHGKLIQIKNGKQTWAATLHAADAGHDLALLKVEGKTPAGLACTAPFPAVGKEVFLYGAPVFRHRVWFPGRVARPDVTYEYLGTEKLAIRCYHVAAHGPKGVSGGPWVNAKGEVIGLQSGTMVVNGAQQGLTFVTPGESIVRLLKTKRHAATISLGTAFEEIAEQPIPWIKKLPANQAGVVLRALQNDGPLAKAGAKELDLLVSINGETVRTRNQAYTAQQKLDPSKEATIVLRTTKGETKTLTLKVKVMEQPYRAES